MDQAAIDDLRKTLAEVYFFNNDSINDDAVAIDNRIANDQPPDHGLATSIYLNQAPPGGTPPLPGLAGELVRPEIPNIETFEFSEVHEDLTLRDRLVEQNLDVAVRFLGHCMSLRKEYGEIAKLHLDTEIKIREFFRLDDIHQREVAAGVYENPYLEAVDDQTAANSAKTAAQNQQQIAESLYQNDPRGSPGDRNDYTGSFANKRALPTSYEGDLAGYTNDSAGDHYQDIINRTRNGLDS
jgi:hypothetical protein